MNAKKILSLSMASAMAAALLAGCGSTAAASSTAESTGTAAAAAGKVYYLNFKPEQDEDWKALAAKYTEQTGVPVEVVTAASGQY